MADAKQTQPFDLTKMEYERLRRQKRKKIILWSLPGAVIVFLIALWFILPQTLTHQAIKDYDRQQYGPARTWLTPLTWTSPEPFVIAFNVGTVDAQLGRYQQAEDELSRALSIAPSQEKKCMAAQNLVFVFKRQTEALVADEKEADAYVTKSQTVINENKECFKMSGGAGGGGGSTDANTDTQSPSTSQQKQLEQKEQEGRERQSQYARDEEYNPNSPNVKPW